MKSHLPLLAVAALSLAALSAGAADWPQWRGPERNGISRETGLLKEWPSGGPKLLWQAKDLGEGYATPSVVGDTIYILSSKGLTDEYVEARRVKDGKAIWTARLGKVGPNDQKAPYHGARSTPTVDGEYLYCLGSVGDLVCVKAADGKEVWRKDVRSEFNGKPGYWAYAESPLVDGDVVACTPGGAEATLVALDKRTGKVLWKCPVPGGDEAGYASIVIVQAAGRRQYVQFVQKGVVGVDAKTGEFLWRYDQTAKGNLACIMTPVAGESCVYTGAGREGLGGLVRLSPNKTGVLAEQVYFERGLPTSIGGSVLAAGCLYGTNNEGLVCADFLTGNVKWKDKSVSPASLLCAEGRLYVHGDDGDVALVELNQEAYREKGRFTLPDQPKHLLQMEKAWAYPVLANGRLYFRDAGMLWCYDVRDPKVGK